MTGLVCRSWPTICATACTALRDAIKAQDKSAVAALRSALSAIDNVAAVPADAPPGSAASSEHVAGTTAGLSTAEAARAELTPGQVEEIVQGEINDRREAADHYRHAGQDDMANQLEHEASVLSPFVS